MGRHISGGILTEIEISKRNDNWYSDSNFNLKDEINKVLEDIKSIIDINEYDMEEDDDSFYFKLKLDFINENLYDFLIEMKDIDGRLDFINCIIDSDADDLKKEQIICEIEDDNYVIKNGENESYGNTPFYPFYWLLSDYRLFKNVNVRGVILPIWIDQNKIAGEDETFILRVMNKMKTKYFESELSKCLIFEILG